MNVLIGYDGSDSARDAIYGLHEAGLPQDVVVLVVSLADVWPSLPQSAYDATTHRSDWLKSPILKKAHALAAAALAQAREFAIEGATLVSTQFPDWKVSHTAHTGSPYLTLIQPPDGIPDLIVVGAHGSSTLERTLLGSVSNYVLMQAMCSVQISRRRSQPPSNTSQPARIILGVDGSADSVLAVTAVASRAWPKGTEVRVIAALDLKFWSVLANPGSDAWALPDTSEADDKSWATHAVENVARELRAAGLISTVLVEEGDPKKVLVENAKRWSADCIFVGAKGHGGLERFLLGSVSAGVAARAPCSVEVVR